MKDSYIISLHKQITNNTFHLKVQNKHQTLYNTRTFFAKKFIDTREKKITAILGGLGISLDLLILFIFKKRIFLIDIINKCWR